MNLGPVLIIDDDLAMAESVKEILQAAGHAATIACNAFHGLRLAREAKPAAIVCDMVMPNMSGSDMFRALASDPATSHIPRVMMTGHIDADRSQAHGFLLKPFHAEDMLNVLRRLTRISFVRNSQKALTEV